MATIQPSQLLVSSTDVVLEKTTKVPSRLSSLQNGQLVEAKVLRVISDRQAQLRIKGETVTAKTYMPLRGGQTLMLRVGQTKGQLVLKFVDGAPGQETDSPLQLFRSFGKSGPYSMLPRLLDALHHLPREGKGREHHGILLKFRALLDSMALKSADGLREVLKSLIDGSGLAWESKLATLFNAGKGLSSEMLQTLVSNDLKGLSLQLLGLQENMDDPALQQLKSFVDGIEKQQLLNQQSFDKFGKYLLPLPTFIPPEYRFGQLLLDLGEPKPGTDAGKKALVNISFLLELTQLGDFRADFSIYEKSITGAFGVATEDIAQLVDRWTPDLVEKIQRHGFSVYDISCRVLGLETLSGMTLLDEAISENTDGFLHLMI